MSETTKPGYKTTEFWLTLVTQSVGILALTGVIKPEEATSYLQGGGQIVGGLMTLIPQIAYAFSRGKAKAAAKALLILLLPAFLLAAPAAAKAAVGDWIPANQVTVEWDAVTTDTNGNPLPAAEIRYTSVYVNSLDTAKANPVTVGTTTETTQVFTFQGEGQFILGVRAERVKDGILVATGAYAWSDNAANVKDGKTFGVSRYAAPATAGGIRIKTQ